jgi:hypothetical protein
MAMSVSETARMTPLILSLRQAWRTFYVRMVLAQDRLELLP